MANEPSMFFKAMNFIYIKVLTYGYLAEILLFCFMVFLAISLLFIILNGKYTRYIIKERISFFYEYTFLFIREKTKFIRALIFTILKMIREGMGYKLAIFSIIGFLIICVAIGFFIYYINTKYLP